VLSLMVEHCGRPLAYVMQIVVTCFAHRAGAALMSFAPVVASLVVTLLLGLPIVNRVRRPFLPLRRDGLLDKIHHSSPMPLNRAFVRIIAASHLLSAAAMRAS
jgi:hypothetical protein